jgi:hypothetical protein
MKVQRGNRDITTLIINGGDRLSGKLHASATFPSWKERPATIEQGLVDSRAGPHDFEEKKSLPLPGIETWSVHPTS